VRFADRSVTDVRKHDSTGFVATLADGTTQTTRYILLGALWGHSVFVCPYCDAWEVRDKALAAYGRGSGGFDLARLLLGWTADIVVCSDGPAELSPGERHYLDSKSIRLIETPVTRFESDATTLTAIAFSDGASLPRRAAFVRVPLRQASILPERLGCALDAEGSIVTLAGGSDECLGLLRVR